MRSRMQVRRKVYMRTTSWRALLRPRLEEQQKPKVEMRGSNRPAPRKGRR